MSCGCHKHHCKTKCHCKKCCMKKYYKKVCHLKPYYKKECHDFHKHDRGFGGFDSSSSSSMFHHGHMDFHGHMGFGGSSSMF